MSLRSDLTGEWRRTGRVYLDIRPREREPLPSGEIELPPPPNPPPPPSKPNMWLAITMPMTGLLAAVTTILTSQGRMWYVALPMIFMAIIIPSVQLLAYQSSLKEHAKALEDQTAQYRNLLADYRQRIDQIAARQRSILIDENPSLSDLLRRVDYRERVWERLKIHDDFLTVRVGIAPAPISVTIKPPRDNPVAPDDRIHEALALAEEASQVKGMPFLLDLHKLSTVGIVGGERGGDTLSLVHSMVLNIAAHHSPKDVHLYVISHRRNAEKYWEWVKWLPHVNAIGTSEGGSRLSFSPTRSEVVMSALLQEFTRRQQRDLVGAPHIVVILDQASEAIYSPASAILLDHDPGLNVSTLFVDRPVPAQCHALLIVEGDGQFYYRETWQSSPKEGRVHGIADLATLAQCERMARSLAPLRTELVTTGEMHASVRLVELLNAQQADEVDIGALYAEHQRPEMQLDFPIGLNRENKPMRMILREAGQGGFGSHAILAGMPGTGKSVLLKTIVLSIAATHSPAVVNFLLGDFKAGAAELKELQTLPHVVGYITDLDEAMAERARIAMESELKRRQRKMDQAGGRVTDIWSYNRENPEDPLPHLIIILDEFARALQLNSAFRATMDDIAARGRALGVHLFLSTQRASDFDERIRPNIDFRLSLRVASRQDSMTMFHRPDAADIPSTRPGRGYIQYSGSEGEVFEPFQAAHALALHQVGRQTSQQIEPFKVFRIGPEGQREQIAHYKGGILSPSTNTNTEEGNGARSEAAVLIERIIAHCKEAGYPPAHRIYLPELPEPSELPAFRLLREAPVFCGVDQEVWWARQEPSSLANRLVVPVGLLDIPSEQRQDTWLIDFKAHDGHFWVAGAPGSGKALFLRTLILTLAATHSPADLEFYLLDFGQGVLHLFESLPHCNGNVFRPQEQERVSRLIDFLAGEADRRQKLFADAQVEGPQAYRTQYPNEPLPSLFVVFDNFDRFKKDYTESVDKIIRLTTVGQSVDIHLIFSTNLASELTPNIRNNIVNRLALRLVSPDDFLELVGKRINFTSKVQGRGYIRQGESLIECQVAAPFDTPALPAQDQLQQIIQSMAEAWAGQPAVRTIEALAPHIDLGMLIAATAGQFSKMPITRPIGLGYSHLQPIMLDLERYAPVSLIVSPPRRGKTELLVTLCLAIMASSALRQITDLYILDFQGGHLRYLRNMPDVHYIPPDDKVASTLQALVDELRQRADALQSRRASMADMTLSAMTLSGDRHHTVILIDDLKGMLQADKSVFEVVDQLVTLPREAGVCLFMAAEPPDIQQNWTTHPALKLGRQGGSGIVLSSDQTSLEMLALQVSLADRRKHSNLSVGRGFLVEHGQWEVVQFATLLPEDEGVRVGREVYRARIEEILQTAKG